jgi:PKD repeat protein
MADGRGPSLTLCDPDADNSLAYSWTASQYLAAINAEGDSIFATPGFECSIEFLADFEADTTIVLVGNGVIFTDQTIGNPISWLWTFEGGTPSTFVGQNPSEIIYNTAGTWDVTLEVSDGTNSDVVTFTDYIWSGYAPLADFHADETDILTGTFTNFFSDAEGDDLSFAWHFEGATPDTSNDENPAEIYYLIMEYASYDVTLIVINPFGSDTMTKEDYITTWPEDIPQRFRENDIRLYPNPNNGLFTLELPAGYEANVEVMDMTGRPVFNQTISSGKIDLTGLQKGLYLLKVKDILSGNIFVKRLIIN